MLRRSIPSREQINLLAFAVRAEGIEPPTYSV